MFIIEISPLSMQERSDDRFFCPLMITSAVEIGDSTVASKRYLFVVKVRRLVIVFSLLL